MGQRRGHSRRMRKRLSERTEMRILRRILKVSLSERLRNEEIRARAGVTNIAEKAREARLRWFEHIQRMDEEDPVRRTWKKPVRGRRSLGRQRIRWKDVVERDIKGEGTACGERKRSSVLEKTCKGGRPLSWEKAKKKKKKRKKMYSYAIVTELKNLK